MKPSALAELAGGPVERLLLRNAVTIRHREPVLAARDGFVGASREALTKLGVEWEPTEAERAYNEGRSTQVPANAVVRVEGRFARRLGYGGNSLVVERRT